MNNQVFMHCNYAEQGQTLEQMCALAARLGFDGIEFRNRRPGTSAEAYLDEVAAAVAKHRIAQVSFGGPVNLMAADADVRRRELDEAVQFFTLAAKRFQLTVCNTFTGNLVAENVDYYEFDKHGSNIATESQWQWATEGFRTLGDLAASLQFRLAFETHNCYLHDLPKPTRQLLDAIDHDSVGANLDFGNILLHPGACTLPEAFETLRGRIYYLHLKNFFLIPQRRYRHFIGCRLADGAINNRELLKLARAQDFTGPVVIEAPAPGDREAFAKTDVAYIRELLLEVG